MLASNTQNLFTFCYLRGRSLSARYNHCQLNNYYQRFVIGLPDSMLPPPFTTLVWSCQPSGVTCTLLGMAYKALLVQSPSLTPGPVHTCFGLVGLSSSHISPFLLSQLCCCCLSHPTHSYHFPYWLNSIIIHESPQASV